MLFLVADFPALDLFFLVGFSLPDDYGLREALRARSAGRTLARENVRRDGSLAVVTKI